MTVKSDIHQHFHDLALEARKSEAYYAIQAKEYAREAERLERLAAELVDIIPRAEHERAMLPLVARIANLEGARPRSEWHEDLGAVQWWRFPIVEPPYVGTPLDSPRTFEVEVGGNIVGKVSLGGWPGHHTHWTPIAVPQVQP